MEISREVHPVEGGKSTARASTKNCSLSTVHSLGQRRQGEHRPKPGTDGAAGAVAPPQVLAEEFSPLAHAGSRAGKPRFFCRGLVVKVEKVSAKIR